MTQQSVVLQLPEEMYERVRQIAEESQRPVENILLDSLELVFGGLTDDLSLERLTDEQLWALVHRPLAWSVDLRLRELSQLGKHSNLTADQQIELERLITQYDRYILLHSQVLVLLKQRGQDVERRLKLGA